MKQLLTGKCLADFSHWYDGYINNKINKLISNTDVNYFNLLTLSMQFGVIQDFADSVGVCIDAFGYSFERGSYNGSVNDKTVSLSDLKSLDEAREEAIKQFNKIYNEKY